MGRSFLDNIPGIMQDLWAFDSGFNALLMGVQLIIRAHKSDKCPDTDQYGSTGMEPRCYGSFDEWQGSR